MGVKGGTLPILEETTWPQVVVMGQLNHLTSEPFEARGLVSGREEMPGGRFGGFEVFSVGGGGLVIEDFMGTAAAAAGARMRIRVSDTPALPSSGEVVPIDVGGLPVRSKVRAENFLGLEPTDGLVMGLNASSGVLKRLFIPAGSFFSLLTGEAGVDFYWALIFRELQDVQGAP